MRARLLVRTIDVPAHAFVLRKGNRNAADLRGARRRFAGVKSSQATGDEVSAQAMLRQAAHGFSSGIETRDDFAEDIDHLLIGVDPEASERIMKDRSRPRGIEGWLLDLEHRLGLLEVAVGARGDERVV